MDFTFTCDNPAFAVMSGERQNVPGKSSKSVTIKFTPEVRTTMVKRSAHPCVGLHDAAVVTRSRRSRRRHRNRVITVVFHCIPPFGRLGARTVEGGVLLLAAATHILNGFCCGNVFGGALSFAVGGKPSSSAICPGAENEAFAHVVVRLNVNKRPFAYFCFGQDRDACFEHASTTQRSGVPSCS